MDIYLFNLINQFAGRWPFLDNLAIFFADKFGYILVVLLFITLRPKWRIIIRAFASAIISRLVITNIIRWILPRPRPFIDNQVNMLFPHEATASFPSGHAAFYFALATVVYFYNKKLGLLFFVGSVLMGLARVFSGIHWPSDIIAGALVGIFSAWLVVKLSKRFFK